MLNLKLIEVKANCHNTSGHNKAKNTYIEKEKIRNIPFIIDGYMLRDVNPTYNSNKKEIILMNFTDIFLIMNLFLPVFS